MMQRVVVNGCRIVLAIVFILSGFVKAIDPLGTQYKIQDYLTAMHLGAWVPDFVTLAASVLLSAVEFCLGISLLFAIRRRFTSRLVMVVMVVMTLLTLWLALTNPVSDCGCFGDAIVLTNWQTLWKNVVLLGCAIVVAWRPLLLFRFVSESNQWIVTNYSALFILMISGWCLYDLPIFDFRPYHIGANIREGRKVPEGAELPQFETTFILEKDGETRTFTLDDYPDSTWTFVDSHTEQVKAGFIPPIHDFTIMLLPSLNPEDSDVQTEEPDEEKDITEEVLNNSGYTFLLVSPQLKQADDSRLDLINELYEYARENDYPFYCLTASTADDITRWQDMTGAEYPFCEVDGTTLKTIIRSNPGLLLMKDGVVINKWSHNRLPDGYQLDGKLEQLEIGQLPNDSVPGKILMLLLWFVLPLALLTIADRTWMWTKWLRRNPTTSAEPTDSTNTTKPIIYNK